MIQTKNEHTQIRNNCELVRKTKTKSYVAVKCTALDILLDEKPKPHLKKKYGVSLEYILNRNYDRIRSENG